MKRGRKRQIWCIRLHLLTLASSGKRQVCLNCRRLRERKSK